LSSCFPSQPRQRQDHRSSRSIAAAAIRFEGTLPADLNVSFGFAKVPDTPNSSEGTLLAFASSTEKPSIGG